MAWILLFAFLVVRLALDGVLWRELPFYYSYVFEFALIVFSFFVFRREVKNNFRLSFNKYLLISILCFFAFGYITFQVMSPLGLSFPMNFRDPEIMLIAFLIAPVLEEGLFRFLLWESFLKLKVTPRSVLWLTSMLFAFSHFLAYFQLTGMFQNFVIYQTIYTFILALFLGIVRLRTNSILTCILCHFVFNLGFATITLIHG